ncbi:hypothetical protein GCM10027091_79250 [Streptomyces daliensis]
MKVLLVPPERTEKDSLRATEKAACGDSNRARQFGGSVLPVPSLRNGTFTFRIPLRGRSAPERAAVPGKARLKIATARAVA